MTIAARPASGLRFEIGMPSTISTAFPVPGRVFSRAFNSVQSAVCARTEAFCAFFCAVFKPARLLSSASISTPTLVIVFDSMIVPGEARRKTPIFSPLNVLRVMTLPVESTPFAFAQGSFASCASSSHHNLTPAELLEKILSAIRASRPCSMLIAPFSPPTPVSPVARKMFPRI